MTYTREKVNEERCAFRIPTCKHTLEYMIKTYCYDRSDHERFISNKRKKRKREKNKRRPYVWHSDRHIWFIAHDLLSTKQCSEGRLGRRDVLRKTSLDTRL